MQQSGETQQSEERWWVGVGVGVGGGANHSSGPDRRRRWVGRHRVNKQQISFHTKLATTGGDGPSETSKKAAERQIC